jgi:hypothetical protein
MLEKNGRVLRLFPLAMAIMMAGCSLAGGQTSAAPTEDTKLIQTEVAETVVAKITYEAALTEVSSPSETPAPTNTLEPSPTATLEQATEQQVATLQILPSATATTHTSSSGTGYSPSKTPTYYPDHAVLVSQDPQDWTVLKPGEEIDLKWTVKNTGVREWTTDFYYRYLSGPTGTDGDIYMFQHSVPVGSTIVLIVDMTAPYEPGTYTTTWQLINDDGTAILTPYFSFTVAP